MFFKNFSRRRLVLSLSGLGLAILGRSVNAQSLSASKIGTSINIVADSLANSVWELQKSIDGGVTWTTVPSEKGQTRWDIPISANEPTAIFMLKLVTDASLTVAGNTYKIPVTGQALFNAMTTLPLTFKSQLYAGLGQFVTEINGTKKGNGLNWILFLNEQSTAVGSSQVIPKAGDKIEWRLI